jgi:hypothetical protein
MGGDEKQWRGAEGRRVGAMDEQLGEGEEEQMGGDEKQWRGAEGGE